MAVPVSQATLFDVDQADRPAPPRPATPRRRRLHVLDLPNPWGDGRPACDPVCVTCGRPEGTGTCWPRCAVVCGRPDSWGPVEVCLVPVRVTARLVTGVRRVGRDPVRWAVVDPCPWCGRLHWHAPAYGLHYRLAPCGRPYLVQLDRPRPAAEHTLEHAVAAARGAARARQVLADH